MIDIRPITILVGRNSAGKSTFLRSLPLIKQSIEARASAPILWNGRTVDYGDFQTAVRNRDTDENITFSFEARDIEVRSSPAQRSYYFYFDEPSYGRKRTKITSAKLEFEIGLQVQRTSKVNVYFDLKEHDISLKIKLAKDGRRCDDVIVNGISAAEKLPRTDFTFLSGALFAPLRMYGEVKSERSRTSLFGAHEPLVADVLALLKPAVDKRIAEHNLIFEALKILQRPRLTPDVIRSLIERTELKSVKKLYQKWIDGEGIVERNLVDWMCSLNHAVSSYGSVCQTLQDTFKNTHYIGPARASSERYYRFQELEVSEIAPDGENLPMFLASLSSMELSDFSNWVENIFGYGVTVSKPTGHVSVNLKRGDFVANVADTGYGVSQVLPILAQTWWANRSRSRSGASNVNSITGHRIFAMEQPELHLHPAHQAKLADVFVEAYSNSKRPVHYVIETHSESLINRLGELIENGDIPSTAVQIVIFSNDDDNKNSNSKVQISTFDDNGHLIEWPFGFFSY